MPLGAPCFARSTSFSATVWWCWFHGPTSPGLGFQSQPRPVTCMFRLEKNIGEVCRGCWDRNSHSQQMRCSALRGWTWPQRKAVASFVPSGWVGNRQNKTTDQPPVRAPSGRILSHWLQLGQHPERPRRSPGFGVSTSGYASCWSTAPWTSRSARTPSCGTAPCRSFWMPSATSSWRTASASARQVVE